jgi:hypothetical protein
MFESTCRSVARILQGSSHACGSRTASKHTLFSFGQKGSCFSDGAWRTSTNALHVFVYVGKTPIYNFAQGGSENRSLMKPGERGTNRVRHLSRTCFKNIFVQSSKRPVFLLFNIQNARFLYFPRKIWRTPFSGLGDQLTPQEFIFGVTSLGTCWARYVSSPLSSHFFELGPKISPCAYRDPSHVKLKNSRGGQVSQNASFTNVNMSLKNSFKFKL